MIDGALDVQDSDHLFEVGRVVIRKKKREGIVDVELVDSSSICQIRESSKIVKHT